MYVPNLNNIKGYSLAPAEDHTVTTATPEHPYLTGTCSDSQYTTYANCTSNGETWTPSLYPLSELYSNNVMLNHFYDISYNVRANSSLNKLFLRAVLKGSKDKSPVVRALELTSE